MQSYAMSFLRMFPFVVMNALMSVSCCNADLTLGGKEEKAVAGSAAVKLVVNGKNIHFTHAIVTSTSYGTGGHLQLILGPSSLNCKSPNRGGVDRLDLELWLGPDKKYFVGTSVPAEAHLLFDGQMANTTQNDYSLTAESVEVKPGGRVKGRVEVHQLAGERATGGGSFDAINCESMWVNKEIKNDSWNHLPAVAESGAISGKVLEKPFEAKSVSVWVAPLTRDSSDESGKSRGVNVIRELCVNATPNTPCSCLGDTNDKVKEGFSFTPMHGASELPGTISSSPITGRPIPFLSTQRYVAPGAEMDPEPNGWIQWDSLSYTAGSKVTGSLALAASSAHSGQFVKMSGHFEATVCTSGPTPTPSKPNPSASSPARKPKFPTRP